MQKLQILRILTTQFLTEGYPQVGRQREAYASWFLHRILRAGSRKPIEQIQKSNCANNKIIFATHVRTITNEQNGRMKPHKTTGKTTTRYEDTISKESKKAKKNNWTPPNGWSRHLLLPEIKQNPILPDQYSQKFQTVQQWCWQHDGHFWPLSTIRSRFTVWTPKHWWNGSLRAKWQ